MKLFFLIAIFQFFALFLSCSAFAEQHLSCNAFVRFINNAQNFKKDVFFSIEQSGQKIVTVDLPYSDLSAYLRVDSGPLIINAYDTKGILISKTIMNVREGGVYSVALNGEDENSKISSFFDTSILPTTDNFSGNYYKFSSVISRFTMEEKSNNNEDKEIISFGILGNKNFLKLSGSKGEQYHLKSEVLKLFDGFSTIISSEEQVIENSNGSENIIDIFEFNDIANSERQYDGHYFYDVSKSVKLVVVKSRLFYDKYGCIAIEGSM